MKKTSYIAIAQALASVDFENKAEIMEELNKEITRNDEAKARKEQEYESAWAIVSAVLHDTKTPLPVSEIFEAIEDELPEGFKKGQIQYGLNHTWADRVVKYEGKPNTYGIA